MKKNYALLVAFVGALGLQGCFGDKDKKKDDSKTPAAKTAAAAAALPFSGKFDVSLVCLEKKMIDKDGKLVADEVKKLKAEVVGFTTGKASYDLFFKSPMDLKTDITGLADVVKSFTMELPAKAKDGNDKLFVVKLEAAKADGGDKKEQSVEVGADLFKDFQPAKLKKGQEDGKLDAHVLVSKDKGACGDAEQAALVLTKVAAPAQ